MPNQQSHHQGASSGQARIWLMMSHGQPDREVAAFWERPTQSR
jgi:hypothetical protein